MLSEMVKQGEEAAEHTVKRHSEPLGVMEGLEVRTVVNEPVASSKPLATTWLGPNCTLLTKNGPEVLPVAVVSSALQVPFDHTCEAESVMVPDTVVVEACASVPQSNARIRRSFLMGLL
jgi:hypothetical protein